MIDMRQRTVLALAVVGLLLAGLGALFVLVAGRGDGPAEEARAYLAAWERADYPAMAELVDDPPAGFAGSHRSILEGLHVEHTRLTLGRVDRDGSRATASFEADLALTGLGRWRYEGELEVVRRSGRRWRVAWTPASIHPSLQPGERLARTREWQPRAPILAADGSPITTQGTVVAIGVEPRRVKDVEAVATALAQHAGVDPDRVRTALARPGLRPDVFVPFIELREERYAAARPALQPVLGIVFRRGPAHLTPAEGFARHTVGRVGEATAERLEQLGSPYQAGDRVGLSGLEAARERELAGRPSGEVRVLDRAGHVRTVLHRFPAAGGKPVRTTIDLAVQRAADEALATVAGPAALVAVDARTGEIRAAASRPLDQPLHRALVGRFPPGSTFKIVTAAALLAGGTTPDTPVECPAEATVGGTRFRNFEGEAPGTLSFADAFAHSCNTAFVGLAGGLTNEALRDAAQRFGFGASYRLPLSTAGGRFPNPTDDAERAAAAIGQGRVTASPLHMATVVAAAVDGTWRAPRLLADADAPAGKPLSAPVTSALRGLLRRVVVQGTGTAAAVRGREVGGKTGTAEYGSGTPPPTHALFVGHEGPLAFAVLVEGGGVGGRVAAPVAARFVAALPRPP
jgi:cell division protein FtsI/penicillin-binding protein 2